MKKLHPYPVATSATLPVWTRRTTLWAAAFVGFFIFAAVAPAQMSPAAQATLTVNGKKLTIAYSAPSVRGRKIFGDGGVVSKDPTYPVWRAGANNATTFQTEADLTIGGLNVPKGIYTFYVLVKDPNAWELIVSKETGQWGLDYHPNRDLGRVKMEMSKPPALVERMKFTLSSAGGNNAKLELAWENHVASVPVVVR